MKSPNTEGLLFHTTLWSDFLSKLVILSSRPPSPLQFDPASFTFDLSKLAFVRVHYFPHTNSFRSTSTIVITQVSSFSEIKVAFSVCNQALLGHSLLQRLMHTPTIWILHNDVRSARMRRNPASRCEKRRRKRDFENPDSDFRHAPHRQSQKCKFSWPCVLK